MMLSPSQEEELRESENLFLLGQIFFGRTREKPKKGDPITQPRNAYSIFSKIKLGWTFLRLLERAEFVQFDDRTHIWPIWKNWGSWPGAIAPAASCITGSRLGAWIV
jgi:hypothetical protein